MRTYSKWFAQSRKCEPRDQLADALTQPLPRTKFIKRRDKTRVSTAPSVLRGCGKNTLVSQRYLSNILCIIHLWNVLLIPRPCWEDFRYNFPFSSSYLTKYFLTVLYITVSSPLTCLRPNDPMMFLTLHSSPWYHYVIISSLRAETPSSIYLYEEYTNTLISCALIFFFLFSLYFFSSRKHNMCPSCTAI